jgi:hypothetical protein
MTKVQKPNTISFNIKGIDIIDFNITLPADPLQQEIKSFNFNITSEQKISIEQKLVYTVISIEIFNDNFETKLGSFRSAIIFEITNFDDFIDKNTQNFKLPDDITMVLNSVSISTTRGLMFSQFKGTFLNNAFLPIVDPQLLRKKD